MNSHSCHVCGCDDVLLDRVHDGRAEIQLSECPRCEARWTGPIEAVAPRRRAISSRLAGRPQKLAQNPSEGLSQAA